MYFESFDVYHRLRIYILDFYFKNENIELNTQLICYNLNSFLYLDATVKYDFSF